MWNLPTCAGCGQSMSLNAIHQCPPKQCAPVSQFYVTKDAAGNLHRTYQPVPGTQAPTHVGIKEVELVEKDLACPTCQRFFCKVRVAKGTPIAAICEGCLREGR